MALKNSNATWPAGGLPTIERVRELAAASNPNFHDDGDGDENEWVCCKPKLPLGRLLKRPAGAQTELITDPDLVFVHIASGDN